jgi:hypothetical protein
VPRHPLLDPGAALLTQRGFREVRTTGVHLAPLSPGVEVWLGLNTGRRTGGLTLNPNIGVRHEGVMRWVQQLQGQRPRPAAAPPTVFVDLVRLLPQPWRDVPWELRTGDDAYNQETWRTFVHELDEYGMPWVRARSTAELLVDPLRRGEGWEQSRLALPVLLWTLGDPAGARAALDDGRTQGLVGGMSVDYDAFAARLLTELHDHPAGPAD